MAELAPPHEFRMPVLGADMSAGKLIQWLKKPGEHVKRGDIVAVVETDKAAVEVEVFVDGVIETILVEPGTKVPVGTPLALIREDGAPAPSPAPAPAPAPETTRLRASPSARQLARELGVDLASVRGTGPEGRITREDVERAAKPPPPPAPAPPAAPPGVDVDRQARMRAAISAAMSRSKREVPHYYLATEIDAHRALEWLREENLRRSVEDRLLHGVLLVRAVALALRKVPELNGFFIDGKAAPREAIHVGWAISLRGGGLVAPALHDADRQSLADLMRSLSDLVKRARAGSLRSSEMTDPTITVTSLGEQGVETVFGIIYPPQVALVGFGKIVERPRSIGGGIFSRPVLTATLAGDHRVSDGHRGGVFLAEIGRLLQEPEKL